MKNGDFSVSSQLKFSRTLWDVQCGRSDPIWPNRNHRIIDYYTFVSIEAATKHGRLCRDGAQRYHRSYADQDKEFQVLPQSRQRLYWSVWEVRTRDWTMWDESDAIDNTFGLLSGLEADITAAIHFPTLTGKRRFLVDKYRYLAFRSAVCARFSICLPEISVFLLAWENEWLPLCLLYFTPTRVRIYYQSPRYHPTLFCTYQSLVQTSRIYQYNHCWLIPYLGQRSFYDTFARHLCKVDNVS